MRAVPYVGSRTRGATAVTVRAGGGSQPLRHWVCHSSTGLEWGYGGSGPTDLARSILADRIGWPPVRHDRWGGEG